MNRLVITTAAALAILVASGPAAHAQDRATCTVLEIQASNQGKGIDNALKPLAKKFKKPPFSSWNTFKLLKRHKKVAQQMKALSIKLVPGSTLSLLFRSATSSKKKKDRLRLTFTIDDKNGKRKLESTMNLDSGDYYLVGGDSLSEDSVYILATACSVK